MKIELGGGDMPNPHHPNIDIRRLPNADVIHDLETGMPFRDACADEVRAYHLLQHLRREGSKVIIQEVYRVLKPGGLFKIKVNDLDWVFNEIKRLWNDNPEEAWKLMTSVWGDQDYRDDLHMCGYNYSYLEWSLKKAGFAAISRKPSANIAELPVEASKPA